MRSLSEVTNHLGDMSHDINPIYGELVDEVLELIKELGLRRQAAGAGVSYGKFTERMEDRKLAWESKELMGTQAMVVPREHWDKDLNELQRWKNLKPIVTVAEQTDNWVKGELELGQVVLCYGLFGWALATVSNIWDVDGEKRAVAESPSGKTGYFLQPAEDIRRWRCWVCIGCKVLEKHDGEDG